VGAAGVDRPFGLGHEPDEGGRDAEADGDHSEHVESRQHDRLLIDLHRQKRARRVHGDALSNEAFNRVLAVLLGHAAQTAVPDADQFRTMTTPERLDYITDRVATDLNIMKARASASHRFYDLLSPNQRKLFDKETAPPSARPALADAALPPSPDKPDYNLPSQTRPDWLVAPSPEVISRLFPTAAMTKTVSGKVFITCVVDVDGYLLDCVVDSEEPKGLGFGNAALEMAAYFRMSPATRYGVPVRSDVTVPINFGAPMKP